MAGAAALSLAAAACGEGSPPAAAIADGAAQQETIRCGDDPPRTYERRSDVVAVGKDGAIAWQHGLPLVGKDGFRNEPLVRVAGDTIVVGSDVDLRGFDRSSGTLRWKLDLSNVTELHSPEGRTVLALADRFEGRGELVAIDVERGERRWTTSLANRRFIGDGTPLSDGGLLVVEHAAFDTDDEAAQTPYHLTRIGPDGKDRWSFDSGGTDGGRALVYGDTILWSFGTVVVGLDADTGKERWRTEAGANPALVAGTEVALVTRSAVAFEGLSILALRPSDGSVAWRRELPGRADALGDGEGRLYRSAPSDGGLARLDERTGADLWHAPIEGYVDEVLGTDDLVWALEQQPRPLGGGPEPSPPRLVGRRAADGRSVTSDEASDVNRELPGRGGSLVVSLGLQEASQVATFDAKGRRWLASIPAPLVDAEVAPDGRTYVATATYGQSCAASGGVG